MLTCSTIEKPSGLRDGLGALRFNAFEYFHCERVIDASGAELVNYVRWTLARLSCGI
jgi:hypothetical protein